MAEASRRPKSSPEQLAEEEVCEIVRLKLAHRSWGPRKIRELYLRRHGAVASESTFKRVLERAGLTEKRRRRRRVSSEAGRLSSGRRAEQPNEVWTVDFKGWWRSLGRRCEPLTVRDEHSRYVLEVRALENARSSRRCGKALSNSSTGTGLPQAIRSDNGCALCQRAGIALGSAASRSGGSRWGSIWNGAALAIPRTMERMSDCTATSAASWKQPGQADQAALDLWRQSFNYERPHEALSMRCPGEVYSSFRAQL